ncbi:MAG: class I SAM-dependent methyltransferase [Paracoccaceae bacterium]
MTTSQRTTGNKTLSSVRFAILNRALAGFKCEADSVMHKGRNLNIEGGVVRFRQEEGYSDSFALQWHEFQKDQYDTHNGTDLYRRRYLKETGWPDDGSLKGELIMEAGCGAGAFSQHILSSGADLLSFDYSTAVFVANEHNRDGRVAYCQADILDMPFEEESFDKVFCHGVLQHTPDPKGSFLALCGMVKPGGRISVDVYKKDFKIAPWKSKRLWRWLTTRMNQQRLLRVLKWYIPKWLPIDTAIKKIPYIGGILGSVIPCWNYFRRKELSKEQLVTWAIMDTFDALAPKYDIPASLSEVRQWFKEAGFEDVEVRKGGNGVVGNGRKAQK